MKAPDKLYITNDERRFSDRCHSASTEKYVDNDIEYTCTDAFIEKAKEAFCKAICNGNPPRSTCISLGTCRAYDRFIKLIKL